MKKLIPETIENKIPSNKFVYYFTWLLVAFNFFRSLEHIFNDDGGAQSIGVRVSQYNRAVPLMATLTFRILFETFEASVPLLAVQS